MLCPLLGKTHTCHDHPICPRQLRHWPACAIVDVAMTFPGNYAPVSIHRALHATKPPEKITQEPFEANDRHLRRLVRLKPGDRAESEDLWNYAQDLLYTKIQTSLLVYLLPFCLEAWRDDLKGNYGYGGFIEHLYPALANRRIFDEHLNPQQTAVVSDYMKETIIEEIDDRQAREERALAPMQPLHSLWRRTPSRLEDPTPRQSSARRPQVPSPPYTQYVTYLHSSTQPLLWRQTLPQDSQHPLPHLKPLKACCASNVQEGSPSASTPKLLFLPFRNCPFAACAFLCHGHSPLRRGRPRSLLPRPTPWTRLHRLACEIHKDALDALTCSPKSAQRCI